jgi:hypothetical protein
VNSRDLLPFKQDFKELSIQIYIEYTFKLIFTVFLRYSKNKIRLRLVFMKNISTTLDTELFKRFNKWLDIHIHIHSHLNTGPFIRPDLIRNCSYSWSFSHINLNFFKIFLTVITESN